jgi:hypothetical protein
VQYCAAAAYLPCLLAAPKAASREPGHSGSMVVRQQKEVDMAMLLAGLEVVEVHRTR